MATADKLTTVAENVPKVYHAGQMNVVENAECLKGSKTDTAILLDDISPISHEMGVKVRGKNLIPYPYPTISSTITTNGITLTDNGDGTITANGTATANVAYQIFTPKKYFTLQKGKTYTISDLNLPTDSNTTTYYSQFKYVDTDSHLTYLLGNKKYFTFTAEQEKIRFNIVIKAGVTVENLVFKPQMELGTTATDYTPYVPDLTAVKVSRYGKNLFDINGFINLTNNSTYYGINDNGELYVKQSDYRYDTAIPAFVTLEAGTYTLSSTTPITSNFKLINLTDNKAISSNNNITFSIEKVTSLGIKCYSSADTVIGKLQIELGTSATEYEPYITPTEYTPNADGTVEGVTSLYPNTTLMTDTEGVIIDCNYYKDIDKAFNELTTSVALSGGDS